MLPHVGSCLRQGSYGPYGRLLVPVRGFEDRRTAQKDGRGRQGHPDGANDLPAHMVRAMSSCSHRRDRLFFLYVQTEHLGSDSREAARGLV